MPRRYRFLTKDYVFSALNSLRAAFLAAEDGHEVEEIINGILTYDEKLKIGRRIEIAHLLEMGMTYREIKQELKVGTNTITQVDKLKTKYPKAYMLIKEREDKVEGEYERRAYKKRGGSMKVFKKKVYTGFKRKDVKR